MRDSSVLIEKDEDALVQAARDGDEGAFRALVEPRDHELRAYAYRLLGAYQDAEDALQETRLKAWRHLGSYQPGADQLGSHETRPSFRAWLYRIATNTCLDLLRRRKRRVLPPELGPAVPPGPPTTERRDDILWIEPYPDTQLPRANNPEEALRLRESVHLAFVRAMQLLPPRQRAALVLHDVLDFSVDDIAAMLESSTPAINSALQRARATVARRPQEAPTEMSATPAQLATRDADMALRFARAWETGDFAEIVALLTDDAILTMPPWLYWLDGKDAIVGTMLSPATWDGPPRVGRYRIVGCQMNGQPAGLAYVRFGEGPFVPVCLTVLTLAPNGAIAQLDTFVLPELFLAWGLPATLDPAAPW